MDLKEFEMESHQSVKPEEFGSGTAKTEPTASAPKSDLTSTSGTEQGKDVGNLLDDLSFFGGFSSLPNEPKQGTNLFEGGEGDTHVSTGNSSDLAHDFDYFKEFSPTSPRIDQVSPPRSPFVELDKSALHDDLFGVTAPSAPPAASPQEAANEKNGHDSFKTDDQLLLSEFQMNPQEHQIGSPFSNATADKFGGGFVDIKPETRHDSAAFEMLTTLEPPDFYDSGDSSMSKEVGGGNKSTTDSQVLEPDDLEEYLPKDPVEPMSTSAESSDLSPNQPKHLQPHTADTNLLEEEAITEFTPDVCMTSSEIDKSKGMDFGMFETKDETEEGKTSPYNFYTKEPLLVPEESIPFPMTPGVNHDMRFDQFVDPYKLESSEPSSPRPTDKVDDDHLRQFEAKHAELTSFLQERDPSSIGADEFDRSEDSISPNPQVPVKSLPQDTKQKDDFGFDYEDDFGQASNEPVMAAVKVEPSESRAFPSKQPTTPFEHVDVDENESPEAVDDYDFAVIPPKVPPHRYPLEEPKVVKEVKEVGMNLLESIPPPPLSAAHQPITSSPAPEPPPRDLYAVGDAIGLRTSPPPSASELEKKIEAQKKAEEEELIPFLPKDSFETISPVYQAPAEITQKTPGSKMEAKSGTPPPISKVVRKSHFGDELLISEEAQQILNIFNPKAWFDPNKLHPKVSELVYWRDPKKSGVVFGGIFLVLIALTCLSFISVVAYTSLAILSGTFAFRVYKNVVNTIQKTDEGHPFKEYLEQDLSLENDKSQEIYNAVIARLNKIALQLRHLFLVEDLVDSAKFGAFLYFLTYIGSWFNGLTLLILAFIALFGLPKVYEANKRVIDQYMDLACAKVSEINVKVHDALPFGKKEKAQ